MANLAKNKERGAIPPARILAVGNPGTSKTGALVSLAEAGWKLRILDFDNNLHPLYTYASDDALSRIDAISFTDRFNLTNPEYVEVAGVPQAFSGALKALMNWKYKDDDGNEVDLGRSEEWGPDTILVVDSLTRLGDAIMNRAMKMSNKTPKNMTQAVWGLAIKDQISFINRINSGRHHTIVMSHKKIIGPKDIQEKENETNKELKERLAELIETRYFPRALGYDLPQVIGGYFPIQLLFETETVGSRTKRIIKTVPTEGFDVKIPANLPATLPIETGLVDVFKALGHQPPK